MTDKKVEKSKSQNADWFVQGGLSKIGDIFDRLTGRGWKKASTLSASELTERLKLLLDSEVKDLGANGKFVPHLIKLKVQWNKFSTDAEDALKRLEYELMTAAIDHINDNLYHTYKPLNIEVKTDYFTEGVKFIAGFDEFGSEESEVEMNVTAPQLNVQNLIPQEQPKVVEESNETYIAEFKIGENKKTIELKFDETKKRMSVGRSKENDLFIEHASVSKTHAALVLNPQKMLLVADTGSTNGTFINENRIAYGRAFPVAEGEKLKFGNIEVFMRRVPKATDFAPKEEYQEPAKTEAYQIPANPTVGYQSPVQPTESNIVAPPAVAPVTFQPAETVAAAPPISLPPSNDSFESEKDEDVAGNTQQHLVKLNFDD